MLDLLNCSRPNSFQLRTPAISLHVNRCQNQESHQDHLTRLDLAKGSLGVLPDCALAPSQYENVDGDMVSYHAYVPWQRYCANILQSNWMCIAMCVEQEDPCSGDGHAHA